VKSIKVTWVVSWTLDTASGARLPQTFTRNKS
jgi:hypothetical protein